MLQKNMFCKDFQKNVNVNKVIVEGTVQKHKKGFGFLKVKSKIYYFIPVKYTKNVIHGDRVQAELYTIKEQKFVKPIKLIKAYLKSFIGKIKIIRDKFCIEPYELSCKNCIIDIINFLSFENLHDGDWFLADFVHHKLNNNKTFSAKLITHIAYKNDNCLPWKVILSHYNIKDKFSEMDSYEITFDNSINRIDLTHLEFITIDSEHTQDLDDAIFICKKSNEILNLIVAIADPTAYISEGSNLDVLASERLFTNYLPGLCIPMLPKILSENLFSLHPSLKKPVLACQIEIDTLGNISNKFNFFLAWIKSHEKLTYYNVSNWLKGTSKWSPKTKTITTQMNLLHILFQRRVQWREKYAIVSKNRPEYKFHFSDHQNITGISIIEKNIAHKIVEEVMIIANIIGAKFLSKKLGFGIYNAHAGFSDGNAQSISLILKDYGININYKNIITLIGFCDLQRLLHSLGNNYINNRVIKYQSQGIMSIIPQPHFALGFNEYLTWTSPIRKYSDMINHRLLKNVILGNASNKPSRKIIANITNCKYRNRIIKRNLEKWLYIIFFKQKKIINKIFQAEIFDIFPLGIKAKLLINGANIFIPINYIHRMQKKLFCDRNIGVLYFKNKELLRVSNYISVKIISINTDSMEIIAKLHDHCSLQDR